MLFALNTLRTTGVIASATTLYTIGSQLLGYATGATFQTVVTTFNDVSGYIRGERGFKDSAVLLTKQLPEAGAYVGETAGFYAGKAFDYITGYNTTSTLGLAGGLLGAAPGTLLKYGVGVAAGAIDTAYAYTIGLDPRVAHAYDVLTDMGPKYAAEMAIYMYEGKYTQAIVKMFGTTTLLAALAYDNAIPQHTMNVVDHSLAAALTAKNLRISAETVLANYAKYDELLTGFTIDYYQPLGAFNNVGRLLVQSTFDLGPDMVMFAMNPSSVSKLAYDLFFQFTRIGHLMGASHNKQLATIKAETAALGSNFDDAKLALFLSKAEAIVLECVPLSAAEAVSLSLETNFFAGSPVDPQLTMSAGCNDQLLALLAAEIGEAQKQADKTSHDEL
jgi:hypothetical protein